MTQLYQNPALPNDLKVDTTAPDFTSRLGIGRRQEVEK